MRSSGTMEDLPGAAFAGQHDTVLGLRGIDAILDAVRRCYASLWNAHVLPYRERLAWITSTPPWPWSCSAWCK